MARLWFTSIVLLIVICTPLTSSQELIDRIKAVINPAFDIETIGFQYLMTSEWTTETKLEMFDIVKQSMFHNISKTCQPILRQWLLDIYNRSDYAVQMIDAMGKPPAGVFLGHILLFGHFDQCLGLSRIINDTTNERENPANYCLVRVESPATKALPALPAFGLCLPKGCDTAEDATYFFNGFFFPFKATKDIRAVNAICVTPLAKTAGFYIMFTLVITILVLLVVAGVIHCNYSRRDANQGMLNGTDQSISQPVQIYDSKTTTKNGAGQHVEMTKKNRFSYASVPTWMKPFLCWHVCTNLRLLFSSAQDGEILFLHGFRALTVFWIILGSVYSFGKFMIENTLMYNKMAFSNAHQLILNSGYAYDSLFLLTGLLVTYVLLRDLRRNEGKINWILVYFHRWWRLTPVYVFVMLFYVYVLPYGIESPFKLIIAQQGAPTEYCKSHWWTNVLYINNFFPVLKNRRCMNWTWFLALDMQFFLITPLIVFILYKSRNAGMTVIGALIIACVGTTMGLISYFGLPINWMEKPIGNGTGYDKNIDYIDEKPYTRITPFLVGIALGYLFVTAPDYKLPGRARVISFFGWLLSAVIAIPLLWGFSLSGWNNLPMAPSDNMNLTGRVAYGGLQRLGWSFVVGWIVFACNYGYGGVVTRFLSFRLWRPISNLTYGAYLVHLLTIQLYFASQRHMVFFSNLNFVTVYLAQIFMSYMVALIIGILVEVPLLRLERLVVRRSL